MFVIKQIHHEAVFNLNCCFHESIMHNIVSPLTHSTSGEKYAQIKHDFKQICPWILI